MEKSLDNLYTTKQDKATTLNGYGITDAVNTIGDQTISGNKTFANLVNSSTGFKYTGGTSTGTFLVQDGNGRSNWYWGTNGGTSPTFTTSGESAGNVKLHPADQINTFAVNYADGTGKISGNALTWTNILTAGLSNFTYKGNTVYHTGNFPSATACGFAATIIPSFGLASATFVVPYNMTITRLDILSRTAAGADQVPSASTNLIIYKNGTAINTQAFTAATTSNVTVSLSLTAGDIVYVSQSAANGTVQVTLTAKGIRN